MIPPPRGTRLSSVRRDYESINHETWISALSCTSRVGEPRRVDTKVDGAVARGVEEIEGHLDLLVGQMHRRRRRGDALCQHSRRAAGVAAVRLQSSDNLLGRECREAALQVIYHVRLPWYCHRRICRRH